MFKKILVVLFVFCTVIGLTGCGKEEKVIERNKDFDKYTGIYKLDNKYFKIVHYNGCIAVRYGDGTKSGSINAMLIVDNVATAYGVFDIELKEDSIVVKGTNTGQNSSEYSAYDGEYKLDSNYTNEEIYKDLASSIPIDESRDGLYKNGDEVLYVAQDSLLDIKLYKKVEDYYSSIEITASDNDIFDDTIEKTFYKAQFDGNKMKLDVNPIHEHDLFKPGEYTKTSDLTKVEVIKLLVFE
jgi:hypothetical protein